MDKGESTLKGLKMLSHHIVFQGHACLNYNHVIIKKDFHNVFVYYGTWNAKKETFIITYDVMLKIFA